VGVKKVDTHFSLILPETVIDYRTKFKEITGKIKIIFQYKFKKDEKST
jgi:hypothetical protein